MTFKISIFAAESASSEEWLNRPHIHAAMDETTEPITPGTLSCVITTEISQTLRSQATRGQASVKPLTASTTSVSKQLLSRNILASLPG